MAYLDKKFNKSSNSIDKSNVSVSVFPGGSKQLEPLTAICQAHPTEIYTNYCSNAKCLLPLCPDCIEQHLQQHKRSQLFPQIQSVKNARVKCIRKLHKLTDIFQGQLSTIDAPRSIQKLCSDTIAKLGQIKAFMIQNIEAYFISLEDTVRTRISESAAVLRELDAIHHRLRQILEELGNLDEKLHANTPATTPTIRKVLSLDGHGLGESFNNQLVSYANIRKKANIDIAFDQAKFKQGMTECIFFDKPPQLGRVFPGSFGPQSNIKSLPILSPQPTPQPKTQSSLQIRQPRTKTPPILHFFQSYSFNLHLLTLPQLTKQLIQLKGTYQIPQFHKSLLLSTNQILLTGGLLDQHTKNRNVAKYDLQRRHWNERFAVVQERSSHSLCEVEGVVYVIGGFGREGGERVLERVDVRTGEVLQEAPSRYGGPNVSVLVGGTKEIVKMSVEGVEVYSTVRKVWMQLAVPNYIYYQSCAAIDINDQQIFIFGGYSKDQPQGDKGVPCSHTLQISDRSNPHLSNINQFPLPYGQGFWNNTPLIFKRQIYALQNIQSEDLNDCIENQRRLLKFDGTSWSQPK